MLEVYQGCQLIAAILRSCLALPHLLAKHEDSIHVVLPLRVQISMPDLLRVSEMYIWCERRKEGSSFLLKSPKGLLSFSVQHGHVYPK